MRFLQFDVFLISGFWPHSKKNGSWLFKPSQAYFDSLLKKRIDFDDFSLDLWGTLSVLLLRYRFGPGRPSSSVCLLTIAWNWQTVVVVQSRSSRRDRAEPPELQLTLSRSRSPMRFRPTFCQSYVTWHKSVKLWSRASIQKETYLNWGQQMAWHGKLPFQRISLFRAKRDHGRRPWSRFASLQDFKMHAI